MASDLDRSVSGIGAVWTNGAYVKSLYKCPALSTLWLNIKRLINANQNTIFAEIEAREGVTLPRESDSYYFNNDSIHTGVSVDPNKLAIWIDGRRQPKQQTSGREEAVTIKIYASIGKGAFDVQAQKAGAVIEGIYNLFEAMPAQELVYGWPANIASEADRKNHQPAVTILSKSILDPDEANGQTGNSVGPIATLAVELLMRLKENK